MTRGSDRNRRVLRLVAIGLLAALATVTTGCPRRRLPSRPLPPLHDATATPQPTPTPEPGTPSLAPPAPVDSLPANPPASLVTAARMAQRARTDLDAGDLDRAVELLEQAVQVDPSAPFAYYYLADAYLRRGRAEEAVVLAQRAATLAPGYPPGWEGHANVLRGRALEELGKVGQATAAYRRALDVDPRNVPARYAVERLAPTANPRPTSLPPRP